MEKYIATAAISILLLFVMTFLFHPEPDWLFFYNQPLASISYIAIIFSTIFVGYQAWLFRFDYKSKKEHAEFEHSYKLAKYYADEIISFFDMTNFFLNGINLSIDKDFYKKSTQFKTFNKAEAETIFEIGIIDKVNQKLNEPLDKVSLSRIFAIRDKKSQIEILADWENILRKVPPVQHKNFYRDKQMEIVVDITDITNKIEYLSMYFCSGMAVSSHVFKSLHQTFIQFVTCNYFLICRQNVLPGHEFYQHTIDLFNQWANESEKIEKERH